MGVEVGSAGHPSQVICGAAKVAVISNKYHRPHYRLSARSTLPHPSNCCQQHQMPLLPAHKTSARLQAPGARQFPLKQSRLRNSRLSRVDRLAIFPPPTTRSGPAGNSRPRRTRGRKPSSAASRASGGGSMRVLSFSDVLKIVTLQLVQGAAEAEAEAAVDKKPATTPPG